MSQPSFALAFPALFLRRVTTSVGISFTYVPFQRSRSPFAGSFKVPPALTCTFQRSPLVVKDDRTALSVGADPPVAKTFPQCALTSQISNGHCQSTEVLFNLECKDGQFRCRASVSLVVTIRTLPNGKRHCFEEMTRAREDSPLDLRCCLRKLFLDSFRWLSDEYHSFFLAVARPQKVKVVSSPFPANLLQSGPRLTYAVLN